MLTARSSSADTGMATASLTTSSPAGTTTDRLPSNVTA